jgi:hypothetical protein
MTRGHSSDAFTIDCLEAERDILNERINLALMYLQGNQDIGYGMSPIGVITLINMLRGEDDELPFGTQGLVA